MNKLFTISTALVFAITVLLSAGCSRDTADNQHYSGPTYRSASTDFVKKVSKSFR